MAEGETEGARVTASLPWGLTGGRPPSACDSQPNRCAVGWFKVIITSTLAEGWGLCRGCWCLMNETLVNTTENMIREPPCWRQVKRGEVRVGGVHEYANASSASPHTHAHSHSRAPPFPLVTLTGLSNFFIPTYNFWIKDEREEKRPREANMYQCVHAGFLVSCGCVATRPNDMCIARCAARRHAQAIQSGFM